MNKKEPVASICLQCGKCEQVAPYKARRRRFCSKSCNLKYQAAHRDYHGSRNPRWKGGEISDGHGRILVYIPGHPLATIYGGTYAYRYRLIAEKKLGRSLCEGEIVHHINGDMSDDRPENLDVISSQSEHARRHYRYDPRTGQYAGAPK